MFRVLVAYEDIAASRRAAATCQYLTGQMGDAVECRTSMWKFDLLEHPTLRELAADDASEADVIVLAAGRADTLPGAVMAWFEAWLPRRQSREGALVALFEGGEDQAADASPAYAFLADFALRAGLDFLPHQGRFAELATGEIVVPPVDDGADSSGDFSPEVTPFQHWGLNE